MKQKKNQLDEHGHRNGYWEESGHFCNFSFINSQNFATKAVGLYNSGVKNGFWKYYFDDGILAFKAHLIQGKLSDLFVFYKANGKIQHEIIYVI